MSTIVSSLSMSLKDYRLLPGYTAENCTPSTIKLTTRLCCNQNDFIYLKTPFISAAMQAVTGVELAIALAQLGGVGVLPVSQPAEEQCRQIEQIKRYKAGFQTNLITFSGNDTIADLQAAIEKTRYTTFPITDTGLFHGRLIGIITDKDFDQRYDRDMVIKERMRTDILTGTEITELKEANQIMIHHGRGFLPIVSREGTLESVVFKKDLDKHLQHPDATVDKYKRLCVGAAISTHPEDRVRAQMLVDKGADFLVIDSADGHGFYHVETLRWCKKQFSVPVIAGNVVTKEGFKLLADQKADAIKIGMGIGSGCTTQEVKATGRGQANSIREISSVRDELAEKSRYIPLIADGGVNSSAEIAVALALGADTVMMGNFFARFTEGNSRLVQNKMGETFKEYWMEGTRRAYNIRRYCANRKNFFEEGIDGFVPHKGSIYNYLPEYTNRLKASFRTVGVNSIQELHQSAVLEILSPGAREDSGVHHMLAQEVNTL